MRNTVNKTRSFEYYLMNILLICVYLSAIFNIRYSISYLDMANWGAGYRYSLYSIFILEFILLLWKCMHRILKGFDLLAIAWLAWTLMMYLVRRCAGVDELIRDGMIWPMLFYCCYNYTIRYKVEQSWKYISLFFTLICIILVITNVNIYRASLDDYGGAVAPVYYCLSFLSLIMFLSNLSKTNTVFQVFILVLILYSTKRAGILAITTGLIMYTLAKIAINRSALERVQKWIITLTILVFGVVFMYSFVDLSSLEFVNRFANASIDEGSGRLEIWRRVINAYGASDQISKMLGHGFHAVKYQLHPAGIARNIYAHNSYLEALYDYGVVGFLAEVGVTLYAVCFTLGAVRERKPFAPALAFSVSVIIILSMLSYFYEESRFILPIVFQWGCVLGSASKEHDSASRSNTQGTWNRIQRQFGG